MSHHSALPITETWFTPPAIIEALGGAESFDLDPCSHVARPWPTAQAHFTIADDGLAQDWFGRVWLNPPYSNPIIGRFLARMAQHDCGTALIFARTETAAFTRHVWDAASALLFLTGRLHFCGADGVAAKGNAGAPSVLVAYGADDRDILAMAPIEGRFVPLRLPLRALGFALSPTWRQALEAYFARQDGPVALSDIYRAFALHPKTAGRKHYRAKLRQALQRGAFERVERGVWRAVA